MLSSHSVVSLSRTVRPCSPWGGRWIGHWKTTWLMVCSSAPYSQAAEEAIPHLYKQEWKRLTSVQRQLSWTYSEGWVPVLGMKMRSLLGFSNHFAFHWWSVQCATCMLLSGELMRCETGTNWCLDLRRCAFALDAGASAEWSRCPSSMTRCARDCGSIATKLSRLDACKDWKVVRWCRMHASSHNSQGIVDEGGYEHCGTRQTCSTLRLNVPGLGWLFAELLQQVPSGAWHTVSASCEVTQGVHDTLATCPTLLWGI